MAEWLLILIRSLVLFFLTLILVRSIGKKNVSNITAFEFINYTVIAILVALISVNIIENLILGIAALAVWILVPVSLEFASMKSRQLHNLIYGVETILIKDGKVMEENLEKERLTGEELLRGLRSKSVFNLADVEFAIMEPTGNINVILKADKKPITPHDMGRKVAPQSAPQTVILDGNILNEPLCNMGLNQRWLNGQLQNAGVSLYNVFIGQVDASGDLYMDLFDDTIQAPKSQVKELLYANIEKCQADLMTYSLETENEGAKQMYVQSADRLKNVIKKLEPYLLR
ncbi:DUF421 domain-containing protein [Clostridium thailandense]|uniref:DUF421 domain-containing protein n=1 Tax=Clostridium thailandense TaxID=2794346 RepID=UPI003988C858